MYVKLESGIFAFRLFVSTTALSYIQFKKVSDLIFISCCWVNLLSDLSYILNLTTSLSMELYNQELRKSYSTSVLL